MPRWGPKRWGLVVHQRIRFESEATQSAQPAAGGVRRARRAWMFEPKNKNCRWQSSMTISIVKKKNFSEMRQRHSVILSFDLIKKIEVQWTRWFESIVPAYIILFSFRFERNGWDQWVICSIQTGEAQWLVFACSRASLEPVGYSTCCKVVLVLICVY